jgi:DNA-binding winged helix-turn-helix (wHTH) protein
MDVQSRRDGQELYEFGEFTLDVPERRLTRGALRVHLAPKTYDVLVALVRRAGHLVTKHELFDRIWPDVFVEEGILTVHVASLRKALGDMRRSPWYIETASRSGYRFIAPVAHAGTGDGAGTDGWLWFRQEEARL